MERLMDKKPCLTCVKDRQEGNPYTWQSPCYHCKEYMQWEWSCLQKLKAIEEKEAE